jgi:hypothetical protein
MIRKLAPQIFAGTGSGILESIGPVSNRDGSLYDKLAAELASFPQHASQVLGVLRAHARQSFLHGASQQQIIGHASYSGFVWACPEAYPAPTGPYLRLSAARLVFYLSDVYLSY